jgi:hypothetical protein
MAVLHLPDVPDDWSVRDRDETIEFIPPHGTGAGHMTILRRDPDRPPTREEATDLLLRFASQIGVHSASATTDDQRDGSGDASSRSRARRADGEMNDRDVLARVWADMAALFTYCHDGHEARTLASAWSIAGSIARDVPGAS